MKTENFDVPIAAKMLTAGVSACIADLMTFPLDTAKVRMQIDGASRNALLLASKSTTTSAARQMHTMQVAQPGLLGTIFQTIKNEGTRSLYGGLTAGLQRQLCFAGIRIGLYDSVKTLYTDVLSTPGKELSNASSVGVSVASGVTTGGLAVMIAQPTDVVKVRMQANNRGRAAQKYNSVAQAYRCVTTNEGRKGLWKGAIPNIFKNSIVNVAEIVCYDVIKETLLKYKILDDGVACCLTSAVGAGLTATIVANPVDVVKTRYVSSGKGEYKGAGDVAMKMMKREGILAFYKGFVPSFTRLVSWNIVLWMTYEQMRGIVNQQLNRESLDLEEIFI